MAGARARVGRALGGALRVRAAVSAVAVVVAAVAVTTVSAVVVPVPAAAATVTAGQAAAYYARTSLVDVPYGLGVREEGRFDCSGSVYLAWRHVIPGAVGPGSSSNQYLGRGTRILVGRGTTLAGDDLEPGDLLFWSDTGRAEDIDHVAMYLGHGRILQTAEGRRSWIGRLNDGQKTRMKYALRPEGADKPVASIDFDVFDAGFTDEFRYGDFNGDGFEDVLWFTGTTKGEESRTGWQLSYGSPSGMGPFAKVRSSGLSPIDYELEIADFNGDGFEDVLWFTGKSSSSGAKRTGWQMSYGKEGGFASLVRVSGSSFSPKTRALEIADFNGDGMDDVLWFTGTMASDKKWTGWQMSAGASSGFSRFAQVRKSSLTPTKRELAFGDFNGDGTQDVLWFTGTTDRSKRYTGWQAIYGSPTGFSKYTRVKGSSFSPKDKRFAYGDFDGDGADDVLWFTGTVAPEARRSGWQLAAGRDAGFSDFSYVKRSIVSTALHDLAYGDFDGDGTDDVMWFTGVDGSAGGYSGWQLTSGYAGGFGYFRRVSDSPFTSYEQ